MKRLLSPSEAREFVWARTPVGTEIWIEDGLLVACRFATSAHAWSRADGFDQGELVELAWRVRRTSPWSCCRGDIALFVPDWRDKAWRKGARMTDLPSESEITELCFVVARLKKHRWDLTEESEEMANRVYEHAKDLTTLLNAAPRLLDIIELVSMGQYRGLSAVMAQARGVVELDEIAELRESCDEADEEPHLRGRVCLDTDTARRLLTTVERITALEERIAALELQLRAGR